MLPWFLLAVALPALTVVLAKALLLDVYRVKSASMTPTLRVGDRVLVVKVHRLGQGGGRTGEVVVFNHGSVRARCHHATSKLIASSFHGRCAGVGAESVERALIKRVAAVSGDVIAVESGALPVNTGPVGARTYLEGVGNSVNLKVPERSLFVLGDNPSMSYDSRDFGPIPLSAVIGRAIAVCWPPRKIALLPTGSFRSLSGPARNYSDGIRGRS